MPTVAFAAPQFLVDDLKATIAFYETKLGFELDFAYDDFYACMSRGSARIHFKDAPKLPEERLHRQREEHLDAYLEVTEIDELYAELVSLEAPIVKALEERPWGVRDFYVQDPEGYILCFAQGSEAGNR